MKISGLVAVITVAAALPSYVTGQTVTPTPASIVTPKPPTAAPMTLAPPTAAPVTPTTKAPIATPVTAVPVTPAPATTAPVTLTPTTKTPIPAPGSTTTAPVTPTSTTKAPTPTTTAPTPAPTTRAPTPGCSQVSVEGDATFCIRGPVCVGSNAAPSGTLCPTIGDVAVAQCLTNAKSFNKGFNVCIAPVTSSCKKVTSGAWGCVWDLPVPTSAPSTKAPGPTTKAPAPTTKAPVTPGSPTTKAPITPTQVPTQAPVIPGATTKAPAATAATTNTTYPTFPAGCTDVSVEGDATFCIKGPVCSGSGASPTGTNCPVVGDYAVAGCYNHLPSADKKSSYCIAPADATCSKIKSGTWGCVWPAAGSKSTKRSLAFDGAATGAESSVGAIVGVVAAAMAVAGAAVAAVVYQRKKRVEQQRVSSSA